MPTSGTPSEFKMSPSPFTPVGTVLNGWEVPPVVCLLHESLCLCAAC